MTDGKAIAIFTGLKMMVGTEAKEACDIAISAIREREERIKGCKYCTGCTDVVLNVVEEETEFEVGFNFCPVCGRKLKGADNGKAD